MITRVSLKVAKSLLKLYEPIIVYLQEVSSPSGKFRIVFAFNYHDMTCRFTTDYLTSKTSHRFMCSL